MFEPDNRGDRKIEKLIKLIKQCKREIYFPNKLCDKIQNMGRIVEI